MSNIVKSFENAFNRSKDKEWDKLYVLVDLHGTIFKPCYHKKENYNYYPWACETLQLMNEYNKDGIKIVLILWTSSTPKSLKPYFKEFERYNIKFDYINENPEVSAQPTDPKSSSFVDKYYFNIGLDDKFGFDPEHDWSEIYRFLFNKYRD